MHPAYSVIYFTVASGAGYGLLFALAVAAVAGLTPDSRLFWLIAALLSLGMITTGLLSSTLHLGHKERAWRALSQWRTSWLSREGVLAVAAYPVALVFFAAELLVPGTALSGAFAVLAAVLAGATVSATAMIYASLKTIPHWHNTWVLPGYLANGVATGFVWLVLLLMLFGPANTAAATVTLAALAVAAWIKRAYWSAVDSSETPVTAETATGLGQFGSVRTLDPPHTQKNYLQHEMGYRVARKHAVKLRRVVWLLAYGLPFVALACTLALAGVLPGVLALIATVSAMTGMLVERWLFFAEARHVVMVYYEGNPAMQTGSESVRD